MVVSGNEQFCVPDLSNQQGHFSLSTDHSLSTPLSFLADLPLLPTPTFDRYAEMVKDHQQSTTSMYMPGLARSNTLSDFSLQLTDVENLYSNVPPMEPPVKIERSLSEDPARLPPSPLRRQPAQKERPNTSPKKVQKERPTNSPKRLAMQVVHTRPTLWTEQRSLELTNSLPMPLGRDEGKRQPVSPRPSSRSSYYSETLPLSPHDARSTTLPGTTTPQQTPVKSSKKKTPGRRGSRSKRLVRWTAKGQSLVVH